LAERGELEQAEAYHRRAVAIREAQLGRRHQFYGFSLNSLGSTLRKRGNYAEALAYHRKAIEVYAASVGGDHGYTGAALLGVGEALLGLGRAAEAIEPLRRSVVILESTASREAPHAQFALARALWVARRDRAGALRLAERARTGLAKSPGAAASLRTIEDWLVDHRRE
jgi:tetratricopeptide (TPR) repeat protein